MGVDRLRIVWRHILPNVIFPLAVQATIRISEAILVSSGLSFLGLGVVPPAPDWGLMISEGRAFISIVPWISGVPGRAGPAADRAQHRRRRHPRTVRSQDAHESVGERT